MVIHYAKGVDYYFYADAEDIRTQITAPKIDRTHGREVNFKRNNLQIQSKLIPGWRNFTGTLRWITRRGSAEIVRHDADINTWNGKLVRGSMANMFNTPPTIGETTVCWGFYDSGSGMTSGLTNQNQLYVYVTRDQRRWMSALAARNPRIARGPFARFTLPGAHDAGMFDLRAIRDLLADPELGNPFLRGIFLIPVIGPILRQVNNIARLIAPRGVANLSMTQKDNVGQMLDIGTRYFDFRPAVMHSMLRKYRPGVRFHQHGLIPGQPYVEFLVDVLRWLDRNPGEIVVVSANTQGVFEEMRPSAADLARDFDQALEHARPSQPLKIGDKHSLLDSYEALIRTNTRLIFLNQIEGETRKYDSYSGAYATLRPGPIIAAFEAMKAEMPNGEDYVVMQMQATATGITSVIVPAVLTASDAHSPLLATKPVMDAATNPWLREHAAKRLPPGRLLVLLNDFVDNCMVETAIMVTEQRARD